MTLPVVAVANSGADNPRAAFSTATPPSWTTENLPTFGNGSGISWVGIAYSQPLDTFVALANNTNNNNDSAVSSNGGATWNGFAFPNSGFGVWNARGICWADTLNLFVVVTAAGPTTTKRVLTSPDGQTWTARDLPDASVALESVAWSPTLGRLCAVGDSNKIYTSPDGSAWTLATSLPGTSKNWKSVVWAGGTGSAINKFVAIATGGGGSNDLTYSSDGVTWTQNHVGPGSGYSWASIGYSLDLDQLVVVGGNTGVVDYSAAGSVTSWTETTSGSIGNPYSAVCWSKSQSQWIAVGNSVVATSPDSAVWTNQTAISTQTWDAIAAAHPASGATGTLATTEADDVFAGGGYQGVNSAIFAVTEGHDIFAGQGVEAVSETSITVSDSHLDLSKDYQRQKL